MASAEQCVQAPTCFDQHCAALSSLCPSELPGIRSFIGFCSPGHDGSAVSPRTPARALFRLPVFALEHVHIPVRWLPIFLPSRQASASHRECPSHSTHFSSASATSPTSPQPSPAPLLWWESVGEKPQGPAASLVCAQSGARGLPLLPLASVSRLGLQCGRACPTPPLVAVGTTWT